MTIHSTLTGALVASLALAGFSSAAIEVRFPETPQGTYANVVLDNYMGTSWELSSFNTLCELSLTLTFSRLNCLSDMDLY